MSFDGYWPSVEKNTVRISEEATDICLWRTRRVCPWRGNVVLYASDSTVLAEGNFVISKEDDLNCSWPPGRGEEIIDGLFQRSCPCWLFWIYGAFGAARNGTSDDGLEFAKAEVWSFYSLPRHRLTAGWAKERFNLTHIFRRRTPDQLTFPRFPIQIA